MCPLIGPTLRTNRLRRGLTLQDAAHKCRISVPRLQALEKDDFASFGNSVYARSFLKLYADFLQIDATQTLEWLYFNPPEKPAPRRATRGAVSVTANPPIAAHAGYGLWDGLTPEERKRRPDRAPSPLPAVVSTTLLILGSLGFWLNTLSADWHQRETARANEPALRPVAAETVAYNSFRNTPPGRREPRQIIATTTTGSPVNRAN